MDTVFFRATSINVRADGTRCRVDGDPQPIGRETAERLVAGGLGEIVGADADEGADPNRAATIAAAVETLSDADWTDNGKPKVAAVKKASGLADVSADELAGFEKPEAS